MRVDKGRWRAQLLAARRAVPPEVRAAEADALARVVPRWTGMVCAYHPVGTEPGSAGILDALRDGGARVLLPVVAGHGTLDWAEHDGALRSGPLGLLEPVGPRLGSAAVADAAVVLVPALAVDRGGTRLGRGAGYYDRTLLLTTGGTQLVAVVRDVELVEELPAEQHDVRVTAALTPGRGLLPLQP